MPSKGVGVRPRVHVPQLQRPAPTTCECVSIGTERYAIDPIRMPGERVGVCPRVGIPQSHRVVPTPATCE